MRRRRPGDSPGAVSEAEARAFGGTDAEAILPLAELVQRAAELTTGEWWAESGAPAVTVRPARASARSSRARARPDGAAVVLALADGQLDLATLAHELAHALAGVGHGHDARYRTAAVDVATVLVGLEAGAALAAAFDAFGLDRRARAWPAPWRVDGPGFRVLAPRARVDGNHLSG